MAARNWTEEQKRQQSQRIQTWKPWESSTGPRTKQGKAIASRNSLKHGMRSQQAIVSSQEAQEYLKQARELIKQVQQNLEKWHA